MEYMKQYILKNLKLKVLALVLAAIFWFAISNIGESRMTISVPLLTGNLGKEFIIKKMETDAVLVTINGPISILKNLRARDIRFTVNLGTIKEGAHIFTLQKGDVVVPKGIKVVEIKPDYTAIEIDKIVEKRLRTVVKLDEKWMNIYTIKTWTPLYVNVEGARESFWDKDTIETIPVDGHFEGKEEEVDTALDTKGMVVKRVRPETVKVFLRRN
ncbi:MAG: hypothetical protein C0392_08540 [Syntrophus sp. (in: bacteria)]|nr:hypothetical protein [Syntrophus sp. (in: bacteria)]